MDQVVRAFLRIASAIVPAHERGEWLEEWRSELWALAEARRRGVGGLPGRLEFAMGALPHALWTRAEGWTVDGVWQDLRYAIRRLRLSPGFTAVAALTLALGIGANASIFSLVNGLLFRAPAGIEAPDRLVQIARSYETAPRWDNFSWPALQTIRREGRAFMGVAGYSGQSFTLGTGPSTERVIGQEVTGDFFELLGVRPQVGRLLRPTDDVEPGGHPVVVLSHALWTRRYGGDRDLVGRTIQIGNAPYEVIGVASAGFAGLEAIGSRPELWVPTMQHPGIHGNDLFDQWGSSWINVVGRLADGVDIVEAQASTQRIEARLREADPVNEEILVLLAEGVVMAPDERTEARGLALVLAMIVGVVLLLTCTNVANLLLARAAGRRTEVGVRIALGAGRGRLVQQLVAESIVLALFATLLAIPIVLSADRFVPLLFPYNLSVSVGADARVFLFLAIVGLGAGLLFGAAPAWASTRRETAAALREGGTTGGRNRTRLRDALVVVQLGLSLGLVACAALLGRSVSNAATADPGFDPVGVAVGMIDVGSTGRYSDEESRALLERLVAAARAIPGVSHATVANSTPILGGHSRASVQPAGRDDVSYEAEYNIVGPGYFETMGIPIVAGRAIGAWAEEPEAVVVVNESLARMFWPGQDPVGQELAGNPARRVVGVAGDVQMRSLRAAARPGVYYPLEHASPIMLLHVRGAEGRTPGVAALQGAVAVVDPGMPVRVSNLREAISASLAETRSIGALIGAFAGLALLLAAVGLYGLVSYGASQRVREMGIRIALGARPESLSRLVLARGLGIALVGIVAGVGIAYGLGQALESLLFGVGPGDPLVLTLASVTLLLTAGLAAWIPARRASRVDPAVSLRD